MNCGSCGKREGKYKSLSGGNLCHKCAHELGLLHKHSPGIPYPGHLITGASLEEIAAHLDKYLDTEAED